jgi:microcystin-dependent protein
MSEPFIGEIRMFGGNFAPRGWALCDGQLLPIASNSALFSIVGTMYGGDGRSTFGLPDLRGRSAVHPGNGPGLSDIRQGSKGGSETTTLTVANLPAHGHQVAPQVTDDERTTNRPDGAIPGRGGHYTDVGPSTTVTTGRAFTTGNTGGGQAFDHRSPYQAVNYIIALQGLFPSRN